MATLLNNSSFLGDRLDDALQVFSTTSSVELIDGLSALKTADRTQWANGELTYTIVLDNQSGEDYVEPIFVDPIDTTVATLVENSVKLNGNSLEYTFVLGNLRAELPTLVSGQSHTITFSVVRV